MEKLIQDMLSRKVWAVVGATENQSKFGYKIFEKLRRFGYEVYPVNPVYSEVSGEKCYPNLSELPVKPECISVVVGPDKSPEVVMQAKELGIENIWFQPGTYTPDIIDQSETAGLNTVYMHCVLVELDK